MDVVSSKSHYPPPAYHKYQTSPDIVVDRVVHRSTIATCKIAQKLSTLHTHSPDALESNFSTHRLVLGSGKYIVENVANVQKLPARGAHMSTMPIKIGDGTEVFVQMIALG